MLCLEGIVQLMVLFLQELGQLLAFQTMDCSPILDDGIKHTVQFF
jgi:hypothetical protein